MIRIRTASGQCVTAETEDAARRLATELGLDLSGATVEEASPTGIKPRPVGVWSDLTESWVVRPTTDVSSLAAALAARPHLWHLGPRDDEGPCARHANGGPDDLRSAEKALWETALKLARERGKEK